MYAKVIALLPVWPGISIFSFSSTGFSFFDIFSSFETGIGANLRGAGVSKGDFCLSKPVSSTSLESALKENKLYSLKSINYRMLLFLIFWK